MEPVAVDPAVLLPLPAQTDPTYTATRARNAELAATQAIQERNAERDARMTNAVTQGICASWAREPHGGN